MKQKRTKPTRKHIGEATIQPKAKQGKECKRSKNNMLEGREGEREQEEKQTLVRPPYKPKPHRLMDIEGAQTTCWRGGKEKERRKENK